MQRFGLGPVIFIIAFIESLLCPFLLIKYVGDATLFFPENAIFPAEGDVAYIMERARNNKMTVNMVKTKEIMFHRSYPKLDIFPIEFVCIQRATASKLLGVPLEPDFNSNYHVSSRVTSCNPRLCL